MTDLELMKLVSRPSPSKIVLMVIDGLGGLPHPQTGKTELETAATPNMDRLASEGICGLADPVSPGITPGSTTGHLAIFGYDPVRFNIGRGFVEAVGVDFNLQDGDVAARGNFCTVDDKGLITDRRAGRISTDKSAELCNILDGMVIDNVKVLVHPVKEHRFIAVFRGEGLAAELTDSDPQQLGVVPKTITALVPEAERIAGIANRFVSQAVTLLHEYFPANMVLMRGFARHPQLPAMSEIYKLKPAAIAVYPMYRGLARLVGMEVMETGATIEEEIETLKQCYKDHDFFFIHVKATDAAGEDGDFERKVKAIEQVDRALPAILELQPEVLVVTGDHSTPAVLKGHSWHPVPVLLHSRYCRRDNVKEYSESACVLGGLGRIPAVQVMPLAMANALKLEKFGA